MANIPKTETISQLPSSGMTSQGVINGKETFSDLQGNTYTKNENDIGKPSYNVNYTKIYRDNSTQTSPSVLSNSNIIENVIPDNTARLDNLSNKGMYTDQQGIMRYSDGTLVPPPQGAEPGDKGVYTFNGVNYGAPPNDTSYENSQEQQLLDSMKSNLDASTKALIDSIQQKYEVRRQQVKDINTRQQKGRMQSLLMGGSSQYAPLSSEGIVAEGERYGIMQLNELDSEENDAIAQAKAAQQSGEFQIMEKSLAMAEAKRKEKIDLATKINEDVLAENKKIRENAIQASRDGAIANLLSQGLTDPADILNALNYDDSGNQTGDFTAEEVQNTLKNFAKNTGTSIDGLTGNVKNFYILKDTKGGLPTSILALPEDEQLPAYLNMISGKSSSASSTTSDAEAIADAIIDGKQPPVLTGLYSKSSAVRAALAKKGYDLTKATQDWNATQKLLTTLNGSQQTRLRQAVNFTYDSLDLLDELNTEAEKAMTRAGITPIGSVQRTAAVSGALGKDIKAAFTKLDNQISDLVSELATVYKGGNSSTDESLKLAAKQLSSNWDYDTLKKNIELVRKNLGIRKNSLNLTTGGIENSAYNPTQTNVGGSNANDFINNPIPGGENYNPELWNNAK